MIQKSDSQAEVGIITTQNKKHAQAALLAAIAADFPAIIVFTENPQDNRAMLHLYPTDDQIAILMKKILIGARSNGHLDGIQGFVFYTRFGVPNHQGSRDINPDQVIGYLRDNINRRRLHPSSRT